MTTGNEWWDSRAKNKIQNMAINFVTCSTLGNVVSPK